MNTKMTFQPRTVGLLVTALLAAGLFSCRSSGKRQEQKVVAAKGVKMESGSTRWVMAFTDGTSVQVDFGAFTKYEEAIPLALCSESSIGPSCLAKNVLRLADGHASPTPEQRDEQRTSR